MSDVAVHWFRNDLRLHDNIALLNAIKSCSTLIPLFIIEDEYLNSSKTSTNRLGFLLEALSCLDKGLRAKGSRLVVVRGDPEEILTEFIKHFNVNYLTVNFVVGPGMNKDKAVVHACTELGARVETFNGHTLYHLDHLLSLNKGKTPFSMLEFLKIVAQAGEPAVPFAAPEKIPPPPETLSIFKAIKIFKKMPTLQDLHDPEEKTTTIVAGEKAAIAKMEEFLSSTDKIVNFDYTLTDPTLLVPTDTSVLSPYLANGNLSVRLFYHKIQKVFQKIQLAQPGRSFTKQSPPVSLKGQLYWRELSYLVAYATPGFNEIKGNPYCVCMQMSWLGDKRAKDLAERWAEGMTGYPIVDACMRQLKRDGWMHYVARHMCVSYLTRGDIHVSWQIGRDIFHKYLLDADWSINTFSWHWMACKSFFQEERRRFFDVPTYFKRYDPKGAFIKKYVPELKHLPTRYIYEPWNAPEKEQEKADCVIGADYPAPFAGSDGLFMYEGDHTHLIIGRKHKQK